MSLPPSPVHLDRLALAYEIVATNILRELGLHQTDAARAWARFWVSHDQPSAAAPAMRELTRVLVGAGWQVAQVAQTFCQLAEIEEQCRDRPAPVDNSAPAIPMRSSVLIDLLAAYEGALLTEQALAQSMRATQPGNAVAALEEAAKALATTAGHHEKGLGFARVPRNEQADALIRLSQQATWLALDLAQAAFRHGDEASAVRIGESAVTARDAA